MKRDELGHIAERPSWDCRSCGKRWPCDPAREALRSEMGRTQLAIWPPYLVEILEISCSDRTVSPLDPTEPGRRHRTYTVCRHSSEWHCPQGFSESVMRDGSQGSRPGATVMGGR
ncbi:hypothetical protein Adu01nite_10710 [Paractinoplanes durhamensis]|uniref:Uncharacterized protein n=1 Tax=Paractinoplanes durhamensis TaxID=113563 RepID=A0ABQ3YQ96_9ACTN|nr:hypothetical protein Adu01nite_10710 [Actinoplanes durhamensis]